MTGPELVTDHVTERAGRRTAPLRGRGERLTLFRLSSRRHL